MFKKILAILTTAVALCSFAITASATGIQANEQDLLDILYQKATQYGVVNSKTFKQYYSQIETALVQIDFSEAEINQLKGLISEYESDLTSLMSSEGKIDLTKVPKDKVTSLMSQVTADFVAVAQEAGYSISLDALSGTISVSVPNNNSSSTSNGNNVTITSTSPIKQTGLNPFVGAITVVAIASSVPIIGGVVLYKKKLLLNED